jgi:hypothetical protein
LSYDVKPPAFYGRVVLLFYPAGLLDRIAGLWYNVNNEAFKTGDIMKKHLRVTAPFLFLLTVLFCAACAGQGGGDTTGAATSAPVSDTPVDTAAPAETTTSPTETEPETEPPTPELAPDAAASADGFVLAPVYTVAPNVREQNLKVNVGGTKIQIDITSTFFGTESAVDRDTHHWGDIIRYNDLRVTGFEEDFRVGDLNGDRCGELLTYRDRTLTVYALPKRGGNLTPVYTQKLGFAGILCGAGHLNEDGYTDLIFFDTNMRQTVIGLGGAEGFTYAYAGLLEGVTAEHTLLAGDIDDDGVAELVAVRDLTVRTYDYTVDGFTLIKEDTLPYAVSGQFLLYALSDMNSDGAADLVCFMKDPAGTEGYGTLTYMSRRDGHYGSYEHEGNNKNVNVTHIHSDAVLPLFAAGGDITRDGVDDTVLIGRAISRDRVSLYALVYPAEAPAYDYSSHVIKTAEGYVFGTAVKRNLRDQVEAIDGLWNGLQDA